MSQTKPVITISRQAGSRGREAGRALAALLSLPYYDYEILEQAARASGLPVELFLQAEGSAVRIQARSPDTPPPELEQLYQAQADMIRTLAGQGPAVLVGRCADTALRGHPNVVNVYLHASLERRIRNTMEKKGVCYAAAERYIRQVDQGRSAYHSFFSHHAWEDTTAYDLCVCTDHLTPEETAQTIAAYISLAGRQATDRSGG